MPLTLKRVVIETEGEFDDDMDHLAKHLAWEAGIVNKLLEHADHGEIPPEYLQERIQGSPQRLLILAVALADRMGVTLVTEHASETGESEHEQGDH